MTIIIGSILAAGALYGAVYVYHVRRALHSADRNHFPKSIFLAYTALQASLFIIVLAACVWLVFQLMS